MVHTLNKKNYFTILDGFPNCKEVEEYFKWLIDNSGGNIGSCVESNGVKLGPLTSEDAKSATDINIKISIKTINIVKIPIICFRFI